MAKLLVPTVAYARVRGKKLSKFHLENKNSDYPGLMTVCGQYLPVDLTDKMEDIGKLAPEDLCRKCLGALKAVANDA